MREARGGWEGKGGRGKGESEGRGDIHTIDRAQSSLYRPKINIRGGISCRSVKHRRKQ